MLKALDLKTTIKKNINVLQHAMGFFKNDLTSPEKQELLTSFGQYRDGYVPLIVPLTLINPEIKPVSEAVTGPEGCLSFPDIYADMSRPDVVDVKTLDLEGKLVEFRCGGLLSRAIQHEWDHLHGILFIDRMDRKTKAELRPELDSLMAETKATLGR